MNNYRRYPATDFAASYVRPQPGPPAVSVRACAGPICTTATFPESETAAFVGGAVIGSVATIGLMALLGVFDD